MVTYLIYVVVKLTCYVGCCWLGLRLWRPGDATAFHSARFGVLRLGIGIIFGTVIFFAAGATADDLLWDYIKIYTPVRLLEWFILAWLILRNSGKKITRETWLWSLGGIVVSFAADLASPAGLEGHFCVGRCLC
jgi:hypothetical protein